METNDAERFKQKICGMGRTYGADIDSTMLDMYWLALKSWSIEDFESACGQLLQTSKFMPRPYDFNELRKAGKPDAGEAFAKALEIARNSRQSELPSATSGDQLIDAAVRAVGGYGAIALTESDKIGFVERRFVEHFNSVTDREDTREALPDLSGPPRHIGGLLNGLEKAKRIT